MDTNNDNVASMITLRPYQPSDVEDFMSYAGDPNVMQHTGYDTFTSKQEAVSFITQVCIPHPYCRSICLSNRSIGFIKLEHAKEYVGYDNENDAKISFALASSYWGLGITTRAAKIAIVEARQVYPSMVRVLAAARLHNKACHRVLEKLGFITIGVRENVIVRGKSWDLLFFALNLSSDV